MRRLEGLSSSRRPDAKKCSAKWRAARTAHSFAGCSTSLAGDVLTVTRLDWLARSTRDLLNTLAAITAKKAGFKSLGDTWADTSTSHGRLMLTVLGGLAEFERDLIRARTGKGARGPWRAGKERANRSNSPTTRSARRSNAASRARSLPTSGAAMTSVRLPFPD